MYVFACTDGKTNIEEEKDQEISKWLLYPLVDDTVWCNHVNITKNSIKLNTGDNENEQFFIFDPRELVQNYLHDPIFKFLYISQAIGFILFPAIYFLLLLSTIFPITYP